MKIAVCSKTSSERSLLAQRFARAEYFVLFDTEIKSYNAIENQAKYASGGASGQAVKILGDNKINVVLCTEVGPKAIEALNAFEIKAFNFSGAETVNIAIKMYQENKFIQITQSHNKKYK